QSSGFGVGCRVAANRGGLRINATKSAVTNQNIANWAIRKGRLPSMIIGVGVDMVDLARFERQLERTPNLRERLFTPAERELSLQSLAARFAAKEAAAKALSAPAGMNWQHCQLGREPSGARYVVVTGTIAAIAAAKGVRRWHLPLSHDGG